ncbi:AraC family transcriptional regulator [Chromobacterium subtsugae]|uniref:AraC family transcriptional regulator n=1 Tax=Chromobacterium subtsugae TaxID=251747 RepID=UPI0006411218|nr:AraC family transcriptional regulator [Chromobacterium subtsugae]
MAGGVRLTPLKRRAGDHTSMHAHEGGQLTLVRRGALELVAAERRMLLPAGCLGWLPAGLPHGAHYHGDLEGWSLEGRGAALDRLPAQLQAWSGSPLLDGIFQRLAAWPEAGGAAAAARLLQVLVDELGWAAPHPSCLPWPKHPALRRLAQDLLREPALDWDLQRWAGHIGMSRRSLIRHFRAETGLGLGEWRERLRMMRAQALLAEGRAVGFCALELGYCDSSAFIAAFRRCFGATPGRFLSG